MFDLYIYIQANYIYLTKRKRFIALAYQIGGRYWAVKHFQKSLVGLTKVS